MGKIGKMNMEKKNRDMYEQELATGQKDRDTYEHQMDVGKKTIATCMSIKRTLNKQGHASA